VPVGLERLQSANAIMFIERAQPTDIVPNRDSLARVSNSPTGAIRAVF
jgi:hypothetical protein